MPKDSKGHGSNAKGYIMGAGAPHGFKGHTARNDRNYAKALSRFSPTTQAKLKNYVDRKSAISAARSGTSGAPPIAHGRPK